MNFLAHAVLSFNNPGILLGNMISDFVKGKRQYDYPPIVQKGIILHRAIDDFTDAHPSTKEIKKMFRPYYGLYAAVFADIVYDYFLANDLTIFSSAEELQQFAGKVYHQVEQKLPELPLHFQYIFPYMKSQNWLYNYRTDNGIRQSFSGIVRRAKYMDNPDPAYNVFEKNKNGIEEQYLVFFPMLKKHALEVYDQLFNNE